MIINFNSNNSNVAIINKNDEIYSIKKNKNNYDLFVKYADDKQTYYIRSFDDFYECLQYVEVGVIKNI